MAVLSKYAHLVLYPVHPSTLAHYRQSFYPSGAKSDPTDADLLLELLVQHRDSELDAAADGIIEQCKADHEREKNKQRLIEAGLQQVYGYIRKFHKECDCGKSDYTLEREIKPAVRQALQEELDGGEDAEELARLTRRLVREELQL